MEQRPKVGVGVIVRKDGKVLVGKRTAKHGAGTWSFAGGDLEHGEGFAGCARREVREEAGIEIAQPTVAAVTNDRFDDEHYVTVFVAADHAGGTPTVEEPGKLAEWRWAAWDDLPRPLFLPIENLLAQGFDPFTDRPAIF